MGILAGINMVFKKILRHSLRRNMERSCRSVISEFPQGGSTIAVDISWVKITINLERMVQYTLV